jgi:flagellar biosynthesis protein FliR
MPADKEEEQITEYGLHIAKDFNVLVLFTDVTFARVEKIQPQMNLRTYK